jgi:hypothetical protein
MRLDKTKNIIHHKASVKKNTPLMAQHYTPKQTPPKKFPLVMSAGVPGFGDMLACISYLITHTPGEYIHINGRMRKWKRHKIQAILDAFDTDKKLKFVKTGENMKVCLVEHVVEPYHPTVYQWSKPKNQVLKIGYQFETPSRTYKSKRLSDKEKRNLFLWMRKHEPVCIGLPQTVVQSAKILSQCDFFLGICGGMTHLAHAVGTPCFIKDFSATSEMSMKHFHPYKTYCPFTDDQDAIRKMERYRRGA